MRRLLPGLLLVACAHRPAAPPPASAPAPALVEHVVRPEAADPEADKWLFDQYAFVDPAVAPAPELVVYLVGANNKPVAGRPMMIELARMGFRVVAPMYADDYDIRGLCAPDKDPDEACHGNLRLEAFEGVDHSPHIEVKPANAIERRVARLLALLHAQHPAEGWGAYLDGDRPAWSRIVIAGHSHGASSAGLIGKVRQVARVVMLSGPFDNRGGAPAPWTRLAPATPIDRYFVFSHVNEEQYPQHIVDWEAMDLGKLGPVVTVDGAAPPYAHAHRLVTALPPPPGKNPHGVTAAGAASPRAADGRYRLDPVFRYLFGR
jgi:hypothetical protein